MVKIVAFWVVTPDIVGEYRHFEGTFLLIYSGLKYVVSGIGRVI
jgi:hypothetical protein